MNRARRGGRYAQAYPPFFLAALIFAALSVPLWALAWTGHLPAPVDPLARHAHEMLLGYALAVVGGFLFNKISRTTLALALGLWLVARIAAELPAHWTTAALSLGFPVCVFLFAGLPFMRAARTAHNRVFAPVLGAFTLAELLFQLGALGLLPDGQRRGIMLALDLIVLLLFVMGGRLIPAATAGVVRDKGGFLPQRVQPWLEWGGIGSLALALVLDVGQVAPAAAGTLSAAAGIAALVRLARWRTHWTLDVPAVGSLHLGYLWLALGLALKGAAQALGVLALADAIHALTIGALGTLTVAMMLRTVLQRRGLAVRFGPAATAAVLLPSAAATARLAGSMHLASLLWAAAMLLATLSIIASLRKIKDGAAQAD